MILSIESRYLSRRHLPIKCESLISIHIWSLLHLRLKLLLSKFLSWIFMIHRHEIHFSLLGVYLIRIKLNPQRLIGILINQIILIRIILLVRMARKWRTVRTDLLMFCIHLRITHLVLLWSMVIKSGWGLVIDKLLILWIRLKLHLLLQILLFRGRAKRGIIRLRRKFLKLLSNTVFLVGIRIWVLKELEVLLRKWILLCVDIWVDTFVKGLLRDLLKALLGYLMEFFIIKVIEGLLFYCVFLLLAHRLLVLLLLLLMLVSGGHGRAIH